MSVMALVGPMFGLVAFNGGVVCSSGCQNPDESAV